MTGICATIPPGIARYTRFLIGQTVITPVSAWCFRVRFPESIKKRMRSTPMCDVRKVSAQVPFCCVSCTLCLPSPAQIRKGSKVLSLVLAHHNLVFARKRNCPHNLRARQPPSVFESTQGGSGMGVFYLRAEDSHHAINAHRHQGQPRQEICPSAETGAPRLGPLEVC